MGLLGNLKESLKQKPQIGNRILIPMKQTKLTCQNHYAPAKMTGGKRQKMSVGIVFSNPNDLEFECECGIIYERSDEVEEEF